MSKCEVKKIQNDGAVLAFLDEYITREAEYAPEKAELRYIRQSWREVYNAYVESNKDLEIESVSYRNISVCMCTIGLSAVCTCTACLYIRMLVYYI